MMKEFEEKATKAIFKKILLLNEVKNDEEFTAWQKNTSLTLSNIYESGDNRIEHLEDIESYYHYGTQGFSRLGKAKKEAESLLSGIIEDIKEFGLTNKKKQEMTSSITINNNNNNTNTVSINVELFIEAIKSELEVEQRKELKAILDGNYKPEQKKKLFVDKLKSFGSDVASNILAIVLTNPLIFEQIAGML